MAMASSAASTRLLLLSLLSLLAIGASARHVKTLFVSYTFSSATSGVASGESTFEISQFSATGEQSLSRSFLIYHTLPLRYHRYRSYSSDDDDAVKAAAAAATEPLAGTLRLPTGVEPPVFPHAVARAEPLRSLHERAGDALVVVAGLLFGVGCGVLTSAVVFLAWSLISNRFEDCGSDGYDYDDDDGGEDGLESPKKVGYTKLPAAPATPVTPLQEGRRGD